MARYIGSACKVSRRFGSDLGLKSRVRDIATKCKLETPPGVHGAKRSRTTDYGQQYRAKQHIKFAYGVTKETQFRRYYREAVRRQGNTGELLLKLLECRLDNVVYRMGFGSTRAESRQLVRHKAVSVNGQPQNVPSFTVKPGDVVAVRELAKQQMRIKDSLKLAHALGFPEWLQVDVEKMAGEFKRIPDRNELPSELNEQFVVELYSKS